MRQLERQIGVPLFQRHAQRVELTQAGALIAREAMNAFAALRASFVRAVDVDESRLALTTLPTFGTSWLTPRLGEFRKRHPGIALRSTSRAMPRTSNDGRFDAAIRNGHGRWPGMRAVKLLPSIFMPLCSPKLKAAAAALANPRRALDVPLLGRPDWWTMWYRARGFDAGPSRDKFGTQPRRTNTSTSPRPSPGRASRSARRCCSAREIDAGRLVPAHDFVGTDGRAFWFVYPAAREHSRKIAEFGKWIEEEAKAAREAGASFIRRAK